MTRRQLIPMPAMWALGLLIGVLAVAGSALSPAEAAVACPGVAGVDTDADGLSDVAECAGITTLGTSPRTFPRCTATSARESCVDPDSKDVFVIYKPVTTGSLITGLPNPFGPLTFSCLRPNGTSWCGTTGSLVFTGLSSLGLAVHQLTPAQAASDRRVTSVSTQKAIRVSESLDVSSADILGNCQWGKPTGLDGCVIYTRRVKNFIDAKCNVAGDTATNRTQVLLAYVTFLTLHEAGHSLGGLAARYDAAFGGYHYSPTAGVVMAQAAQFSTQGGACTWHIPPAWNLTLDPAGVSIRP